MTGTTILINGLLPYESGKTWFTISLYKTLMSKGAKAIMYKPVAAHNLWYSVKPLTSSIKLKILVGNDAYAYYKETGETPNLLNPIALATAPLDPEKYRANIHRYMAETSIFLPQLVIARISNPVENRTTHYIVRENVEKTVPGARKIIKLLEKTLSPLEISLEEISRLLVSREIDYIVESSLNLLREKYDIVLLESFNDAIVPSMGLLKSVDLLITVAPGKAFFYDKDSSRRMMEHVRERIKSPDLLTVSNVFSIIEPSKTFNIPLLVKPMPREEFKELAQVLTNQI